MTWSRVRLCFASSFRIHLHLKHLQLLTPDRDIGDAGNGEQPRPDIPVSEHRQVHLDLSFVVTPIFMTRLVDDTGGIMTGGAAQVGMLRVAMATRSVTSCRAANSSAPRSKIAGTDES